MNTAEANLNPSIDLVEFKARCLEVLEQLVAPGLIVTKEGLSARTHHACHRRQQRKVNWLNARPDRHSRRCSFHRN